MEDTFSMTLFKDSKDTLLKKNILKTGIDFETIEVANESYFYNRNGLTSIIEIVFNSDASKQNLSQSVGFVTKQLNHNVDPKGYLTENSKFLKHIDSINSNWPSNKEKIDEKITNQFSDHINGLGIEEVDNNRKLVKFDSLNRFIRRENAGFPGNIKYKMMGYCLGRFHSLEFVKTQKNIYKDYFTYLKNNNVENSVLKEWSKELINEPASKYIIGDCTLDNVQYSTIKPGEGKLDSFCFVDPIFLENRNRGEDFSGILATLGRELIEFSLRSNLGLREILGKTFRNIINAGKETMKIYFQMHPEILNKSSLLSVDFFLGTSLLQYAGLVNEKDDFSTS
ncbi:MAG: hypothetical protein ACC656_14700, partial [Candidatus Heimdallarchaeota archaeon]